MIQQENDQLREENDTFKRNFELLKENTSSSSDSSSTATPCSEAAIDNSDLDKTATAVATVMAQLTAKDKLIQSSNRKIAELECSLEVME